MRLFEIKATPVDVRAASDEYSYTPNKTTRRVFSSLWKLCDLTVLQVQCVGTTCSEGQQKYLKLRVDPDTAYSCALIASELVIGPFVPPEKE